MNRLSFVLSSRGLKNTMARARQVAARFGLTAVKMERRLLAYRDIVGDYGGRPSLPITAAVLNRNPGVAHKLIDSGVELCVHGLVHTDMSRLGPETQEEHIRRAVAIFKRHGIDFEGFRSPYLRYNLATLASVEKMGFQYDSNLPFYWEPVRSMGDLTPEQADGLRRGLRFYDPVKYPQDRSLPRYSNGIIEIPVSLPDDEILLDRMGLPVARIGDVWTEMAERALERRELLCLQLHPERILHLEPALRRVLDFVADSSLFWFATMKEIASWWSERVGAALEVVPEGNGAYRVAACGARRLGLAVVEPLSGIRRDIVVGDSIPSRAGPVIGLGEKASSRLRNDIRQLGYFYEITSDSNAVNLYIDREIQGPDLEAVIARCPSPLVVDTFWPAPFSAALAVTGDIDCLTLGDFLRRFWED